DRRRPPRRRGRPALPPRWTCPRRSRRSARSREPSRGFPTTAVRRRGRLLAMLRAAICFAVVLGGVAGVAGASRKDWTGSAACGACHPAELASWQATPHAQTRNRFTARPEARCLGCHATGEAPAGPAIAVEVGCEACHGAGAAYATDDLMRD